MNNRVFCFAALILMLAACTQNRSQYADPFIGTDYTGHTFPAAACPLGLVQPGPNTGNFLWKYCSGYNWSDSLIVGFTQNRLNGTGVPSLCNVLIMPFSDRHGEEFASRKTDETASPGYYGVSLPDNGAKVQVTCSPRVCCYTMDYEGAGRNLFVNLQNVQMNTATPLPSLRNAVKECQAEFSDGSSVFKGHIKADSWVTYDIWFEMVFDSPVCSVDTLCLDPGYAAPAFVFGFGDSKDCVKTKIGISFTSAAGAHANLAEVPGWDFAKVAKDARKSWEKIFSLIDIEASEDIKTAFYTSMYHLYLQPYNIADLGEPAKYSTFSQWDTFRAADPLRTILTPDIEADIVNSMIAEAEERGHLPVWDLCGRDNYCMIANHAVPTVVDACLRKLPGVDAARAYDAVKKSLTVSHLKSDWEVYDRFGYLPFDIVKEESVSRTLEFCYDDYCAAQLAKELGKDEDYEFFISRSRNYRNIFDASTGFFRGRDSLGCWREPFEPYRYAHASHLGGDFTEGNAWHYLWHVLQDPEDLFELLGGKEKAVEKLDTLFGVSVPSSMTGEVSDVTGLIGQYSHGNEPSHHVIYLYTLAGRQDKAVEKIRQVFKEFYLNAPGGLCGNDDCGQMSAWYIFSALGFYPVNPVSGQYVEGEAQVSKAVVRNSRGEVIMKIN